MYVCMYVMRTRLIINALHAMGEWYEKKIILKKQRFLRRKIRTTQKEKK